MTPSETQRTLEIVAKCWRRFESIDNPHEGGRSFAQFLDDEIRREQEVDCSANHQCKACGRFQLFTFDQGWICPECSGRYAGKFPLNAAAPAPAETPAAELNEILTKTAAAMGHRVGGGLAYWETAERLLKVANLARNVRAKIQQLAGDTGSIAYYHRDLFEALRFLDGHAPETTGTARESCQHSELKDTANQKYSQCAKCGDVVLNTAMVPEAAAGDEAGRVKPAATRLRSEAQPPTYRTPQDGASPVPTTPDAAHIPPMKGLCRHDFAGTPNCIKCGADRSHWSAGGSNASTITDAAQGKPKLPQCPWCFWYVNHSPRCTRPDKESPTMELDTLADDADGDLDKDTYEQFQQNEDMPDDAEIVIRVGTVRKINKVFQHIDAARKERERPAPTTTGESGLRECPFCGGRAICASNLEAYQAGAAFDLLHWIFCVECRAQTVRFKDAQHASAAWNTRSTPRAMEGDAEVTRLRNILERDRSTVADGVNALKKAMASYDWLRGPGRGSYAFDDERYQKEFGDALDLIRAAIDPLLRVAGDWTDCPTSPADIAAARAGRRVGTEGLTVEALAAASEPDLFSADADVAHRAASPLNVAYARDAAREKARRTIVALTRHSTGGTE